MGNRGRDLVLPRVYLSSFASENIGANGAKVSFIASTVGV